MNDNNKPKKIVASIISSISFLLLVASFILERLIDLYPNVIREKFGDKFMERLLHLPLVYIVAGLFTLFVVVLFYFLWLSGVFQSRNRVLETPLTANIENQQNITGNNSTNFQKSTFNAPVIFNSKEEDKKKDDDISEAKIEVKEFHLNSEGFQSYGQAVKVGVYINNSDKYNIIPYARLVGVVKRTKTALDEKVTENNFPFDEDKSIFQYDKEVFTKIKKIYFMEVLNRNVVILFEKPVSIEYFSENEEPEFRNITWDFDFEICGEKKNGEQFQNGNYHAQIECRNVNGAFLLRMSVL